MGLDALLESAHAIDEPKEMSHQIESCYVRRDPSTGLNSGESSGIVSS